LQLENINFTIDEKTDNTVHKVDLVLL